MYLRCAGGVLARCSQLTKCASASMIGRTRGRGTR